MTDLERLKLSVFCELQYAGISLISWRETCGDSNSLGTQQVGKEIERRYRGLKNCVEKAGLMDEFIGFVKCPNLLEELGL